MSLSTDARCTYCPLGATCVQETPTQVLCYLELPVEQFVPVPLIFKLLLIAVTVLAIAGICYSIIRCFPTSFPALKITEFLRVFGLKIGQNRIGFAKDESTNFNVTTAQEVLEAANSTQGDTEVATAAQGDHGAATAAKNEKADKTVVQMD